MENFSLERLREYGARAAIVLGSGLNSLVRDQPRERVIAYSEVPDLPRPTAPGHVGRFVLDEISGRRVIFAQGRVHFYEGHGPREVAAGVRFLARAGIAKLILTNAAGTVNPEFLPGSWMRITDHLNLTGVSPLLGGAEFVDVTNAYSPAWRERFANLAPGDLRRRPRARVRNSGTNGNAAPARGRCDRDVGRARNDPGASARIGGCGFFLPNELGGGTGEGGARSWRSFERGERGQGKSSRGCWPVRWPAIPPGSVRVSRAGFGVSLKNDLSPNDDAWHSSLTGSERDTVSKVRSEMPSSMRLRKAFCSGKVVSFTVDDGIPLVHSAPFTEAPRTPSQLSSRARRRIMRTSPGRSHAAAPCSDRALLQRVLDLTSARVRQALEITIEELRAEDWRKVLEEQSESFTQAVGRAAFVNRGEGLLAPSARVPLGINVVYFPENRQAGSNAKVLDSEKLERIRLA